MRKPLLLLAALALTALAVAANEHWVAHALGIDTQQSQNYDFVSGFGAMLATMAGYSAMAFALVHSVNCHQKGCWRVGKHKVGGTPWCSRHQFLARPERSENELLEEILAELRAIREGR